MGPQAPTSHRLSVPNRSPAMVDAARRELRGEREQPRPVCPTLVVDIPTVLSAMPEMLCVMTAAHEQRRGGLLIRNIMRCGSEPVSIAIAVQKGHHLATLIRDSHAFAINIIDPTRKLIVRKFERAPDTDDPFDTLELRRFATGAPILACARAAIECEVTRHFDLESDHEMYVGQVIAAKIFSGLAEHQAEQQVVRANQSELRRFPTMTPAEPTKSPSRPGEDATRLRSSGGASLPGQRVPASPES